jgi:hypothetical protein
MTWAMLLGDRAQLAMRKAAIYEKNNSSVVSATRMGVLKRLLLWALGVALIDSTS